MKKFSAYLIVAVLVVIVALLAFPVRNYYLYLKEPISPLTAVIPEQTAILIKTESINKFIEILDFSDIIQLSARNQTEAGIETMAEAVRSISQKSSYFRQIAGQSEMAFCLVPDEDLSPEILLLVAIGKTKPSTLRQQLNSILSTDVKIDRIKQTPADLFSIKLKDKEIWLYIHRGILALAFNRQTIEKASVAAGQGENLMTDLSYARLIKTSGKRVDGVMMINNKRLIETVLRLNGNNPLDFNESPFNAWTSLDLHIEKKRILFDGFTSGQSETDIFTGQSPVEINNLGLLPSGTAFALTLSVSDQHAYTHRFVTKDTLHLTGYDSANQMSSREIFRREEHLRAWVGNSVSIALMPRFFTGDDQAGMILLELKNHDSAVELLKPYMQPFSKNINIFTASRLPEKLWGSLFSFKGQQYCLFKDQFLAISPSVELLELYAQELTENKTLGSTPLFREASAFLLEKSNISIFAIPSISRLYFNRQIRGEKSMIARQWAEVPASSRLLCMQFTAGNPLLFTHAFALLNTGTNQQADVSPNVIKYADTSQKEDQQSRSAGIQHKPVNHKVEISSGAVSKLKLIADHKRGNNIILTIHKNVVKAFSGQGEQIWMFTTKNEPVNDVCEIGLKQEAGMHYLVAAGKYLYTLNKDGKEIKSSPVNLPAAVAGDFVVFDYDRTKDFRILFQGKDNLLHNITLDGKEPPDWKKPEIANKLSGFPLFFRTAGKDFIVFADAKGTLKITDRRGQQRIRVEEGFRMSTRSGVFENKTNKKGLFLLASSSGNLAYIDINGDVTESRFGDHGSDPWFDYLDFTGDGNNEFIFCGGDNIAVYTKMKKIIVGTSLANANFGKPFILVSQKQSWLVVRDRKSGKIVTLNSRNQSLKGEPIFSDTDPVILMNETDKKPVMVTVFKEKMVYTLLE